MDRGAALDDAGDRGGPAVGRLREGVSRERARCLRGIPAIRETDRRRSGQARDLGSIAIERLAIVSDDIEGSRAGLLDGQTIAVVA